MVQTYPLVRFVGRWSNFLNASVNRRVRSLFQMEEFLIEQCSPIRVFPLIVTKHASERANKGNDI